MSKHRVKLAKKLTANRSKVRRKPAKAAGKLPPEVGRVGGRFVSKTRPTAPVLKSKKATFVAKTDPTAPVQKTKKAKKSKAHGAASATPADAPAVVAAPLPKEHGKNYGAKVKNKSPRAGRERRCRAYSMKESSGGGMVRPIHLFAYEAKKLSEILDKRVPDLANAIGQTYSPDPQKDAVYADAVQTALAERTG